MRIASLACLQVGVSVNIRFIIYWHFLESKRSIIDELFLILLYYIILDIVLLRFSYVWRSQEREVANGLSLSTGSLLIIIRGLLGFNLRDYWICKTEFNVSVNRLSNAFIFEISGQRGLFPNISYCPHHTDVVRTFSYIWKANDEISFGKRIIIIQFIYEYYLNYLWSYC